nr:MAG TPA: hypothetical protein [Caudoviricetes sp.]
MVGLNRSLKIQLVEPKHQNPLNQNSMKEYL